MSNTTIAGKPSNTIGDKDSQLVLRGSSIKIQWGNKFIDLIKNGKINCDSSKILYTVSSEDEIKDNGIYLIKDQIWINIDGTKLQISSDSSTNYVSFLSEQSNITSDQKKQALKNIGFYYDSLKDVQNSGIKSGIVFNQEDNKLYVISNAGIIEYNQFNTNNINNIDQNALQNLTVENNKILLNNNEQIVFNDSETIFNQTLSLKSEIKSENASNTFGFKLYQISNKSYLDVDYINERSMKGAIMLFNSKFNVPFGWKECNGENGTPDLKNNFIEINETVKDDNGVEKTVTYNIIYIMKD